MKKLIVSLAIASSALVATAPASAQHYGDRYQNERFHHAGNIHQRLDRIAVRIDRGFERGALTRGEAQRLRGELNNVARLADRYGYNGLNGRERGELERRIAWLQQRVQDQRRDDDRRYWR